MGHIMEMRPLIKCSWRMRPERYQIKTSKLKPFKFVSVKKDTDFYFVIIIIIALD